MGFIYSNSILIILASLAKGIKDGFLKKRIQWEEDPNWFLLLLTLGDNNLISIIFAR